MSTSRFNIGDRVIAVASCDGNSNIVGEVGTVVKYDHLGRCGVAYDYPINGHNLEASCAEKHGWYTDDSKLKAFNPITRRRRGAVPMTYDEVMM